MSNFFENDQIYGKHPYNNLKNKIKVKKFETLEDCPRFE